MLPDLPVHKVLQVKQVRKVLQALPDLPVRKVLLA